MRTRIGIFAKYVLLIMIVATLAFIFVQSLLPPEKSSEESGTVGEIIGEIIPPETPTGEYIQTNLRKLAHFTEFALLGAETSLYILLFVRRIKYSLLSLPSALLVALFDETVQIFSGRGPAIKDVWIDFAGFAFSAVVFYTVAALTVAVTKIHRHKTTIKVSKTASQ